MTLWQQEALWEMLWAQVVMTPFGPFISMMASAAIKDLLAPFQKMNTEQSNHGYATGELISKTDWVLLFFVWTLRKNLASCICLLGSWSTRKGDCVWTSHITEAGLVGQHHGMMSSKKEWPKGSCFVLLGWAIRNQHLQRSSSLLCKDPWSEDPYLHCCSRGGIDGEICRWQTCR